MQTALVDAPCNLASRVKTTCVFQLVVMESLLDQNYVMTVTREDAEMIAKEKH